MLAPQHDATVDELTETVERVYTRVQRRCKPQTRAQFIDVFSERNGAPASAYATSLWGKTFRSLQLPALLTSFCRRDDGPLMGELRQRKATVLAHMHSAQRA